MTVNWYYRSLSPHDGRSNLLPFAYIEETLPMSFFTKKKWEDINTQWREDQAKRISKNNFNGGWSQLSYFFLFEKKNLINVKLNLVFKLVPNQI